MRTDHLLSIFNRYMNIRNITILITSIFLLSSCEKEEFEPEFNQRTIFMYLPWSTNLTSYFYNNISDMEEAMKEKGAQGERVIVFLSTSSSEAQMFEITLDNGSCKRSVLKEYQEPLFTTISGLTDIINDMKTFAPAQSYSMIIGCHGMGWLPVNDSESRASRTFKYHWEYKNVPQTRFFGGLSPEYQTDITTLAKSIANNGLFMEYILFDDCYMSSLEVAYELRNVTNYMIACPTEIMAFGMPYSTIGKYLLSENPDYGAICEAFYQFYSSYEYPYGTLAVTSCRELDHLASVMKRINERHHFDSHKEALIQRMDGYSPIIFYDYGDYVRVLCGKDTDMFRNFSAILNRVIPYKTHTEKYYSASRGIIPISSYSGITTSEPSSNTKTMHYKRTAWYIDTH